MRIERRLRAVLWLHVGFAATGLGTTLLGCLLPALHSAWHLSDSRAGFLFACQFTGASLGALLVRKNFFQSLTHAYLLLILSAATLGTVRHHAAPLLFFVFGLGLGWVMTATSMLVGTMFERRGAALSLLNVSWVVGAVLSPAIASVWVRRWPPTSIFLVFAIFATAIALPIWHNRESVLEGGILSSRVYVQEKHLSLIAGFALVAFLYVGVEVSVSGWMMTYVHRLPIREGEWAAIITSSFWIAFLSGRAIAPAVLLRLSETNLLIAAMVTALVSLALLLVSRTPLTILLTTVCAGLTLAPIFPLCIARVLALTNESPQSKWVFSIAGLGGAVLSWMTGRLSTYTGSLRDGLFVPVFALGGMLLIFLTIARRSHRGSDSGLRVISSTE